MVFEKAYAKINLLLDVLFKRADGYHEVDMIMQTISLHDEVILKKALAGIDLKIRNSNLPANENNLAYRAAQLFFRETNIEQGVEIDLLKHIPLEAGLAGGSADAAAVLRGMNKLFATNLTVQTLQVMSAKIGSDVAFCIAGGTARATGRGEIISKIEDMPSCKLVVFKPDFGISTAWAYNQFAIKADVINHPSVSEMLQAIRANGITKIADCMGNVLETVSLEKYPLIQAVKQSLRLNGALNSLMSGSGTAVFGIFTNGEAANAAKSVLESDFSGITYVCDIQKSYL